MKKYHKDNTPKSVKRVAIENNQKEKELYGGTVAVIESSIKRRKVERPSYSELMGNREKHSLKSVGELYGVSGVTVYNWIKWYEKHDSYKDDNKDDNKDS